MNPTDLDSGTRMVQVYSSTTHTAVHFHDVPVSSSYICIYVKSYISIVQLFQRPPGAHSMTVRKARLLPRTENWAASLQQWRLANLSEFCKNRSLQCSHQRITLVHLEMSFFSGQWTIFWWLYRKFKKCMQWHTRFLCKKNSTQDCSEYIYIYGKEPIMGLQ